MAAVLALQERFNFTSHAESPPLFYIHFFILRVVHIIGSDCHGMHHRVPNLWLGREVLEKKLGHEFLENMDSYGTKLLKEHQIHP